MNENVYEKAFSFHLIVNSNLHLGLLDLIEKWRSKFTGSKEVIIKQFSDQTIQVIGLRSDDFLRTLLLESDFAEEQKREMLKAAFPQIPIFELQHDIDSLIKRAKLDGSWYQALQSIIIYSDPEHFVRDLNKKYLPKKSDYENANKWWLSLLSEAGITDYKHSDTYSYNLRDVHDLVCVFYGDYDSDNDLGDNNKEEKRRLDRKRQTIKRFRDKYDITNEWEEYLVEEFVQSSA